MKKLQSLVISLLTLILLCGCNGLPSSPQMNVPSQSYENLEDIPEYRDGGKIYEILNNNIPNFPDTDKNPSKSFEDYSELDENKKSAHSIHS